MAGYPPPAFPQVLTRRQRRQMRRRSVVGPLFLVALGVAFLLVQMGRMNWSSAFAWYGHWWPLLLIVAGVLLLGEWALDQATQRQREAAGIAPSGPRRLGGGVVWLLVLMGLAGAAINQTHLDVPFSTNHFNFGELGHWDFVRALGDPHDSDDSMTQAMAADAAVTIDNPHGDVTVSGTSSDGQMHIAIHKQVYAIDTNSANARAAKLQPVIEGDSAHMTLRVPYVENGQADLTIELPHTVSLTVTADRGDVRVSGLHAPVVVNGNHGSVDLSDLDGDAVAHMHSDSAPLSAHSITGSVTVDGRTGDVNVSDIHGAVTLLGSFSGTTYMERVNGLVRFHSHRTDLQMARLDGEMQFDTGEDMHADQVMGPVVLKTYDRNITLERVQGNVQVVNKNGSVTLTSAVPLGTIDITNRSGSVDVGVPVDAGFVVHAETRHGDVENDFALVKQHGSDDRSELNGTVARGGSMMRIETSDGDVTVRKSAVAALPSTPPAPPAKGEVPPVPAVPAFPTGGRASRTPRAPAEPHAPKLPAVPVIPAVPPPPGT